MPQKARTCNPLIRKKTLLLLLVVRSIIWYCAASQGRKCREEKGIFYIGHSNEQKRAFHTWAVQSCSKPEKQRGGKKLMTRENLLYHLIMFMNFSQFDKLELSQEREMKSLLCVRSSRALYLGLSAFQETAWKLYF